MISLVCNLLNYMVIPPFLFTSEYGGCCIALPSLFSGNYVGGTAELYIPLFAASYT